MSSSTLVASVAIPVLVADSNRMQAQLLTGALRRRPEFRVFTCAIDIASVLQAMVSNPAKVILLTLNHSVNVADQMAELRQIHLCRPAIAKILLVDSYDRELVVSAFRSGARELNLSEHTIKKYLFRIFDKLGISTRVELVLYAVNHGDPRQAEWLAGIHAVPNS
jgi:DNA-binding NarL/FixJ family response regulator